MNETRVPILPLAIRQEEVIKGIQRDTKKIKVVLQTT
jgi:hypothetical protein